MIKMKRKVLFYIGIIAIILISFRLYSSQYYPLLKSDDALNIMMAHYYSLPEMWYCWGQDRGGTLIAMLGYFFCSVFGCSEAWGVSLGNYLVLILGYIGFASLLKRGSSKILLALLLFMPPLRFIDLVRFPLGMQYCLIGFSLLWLKGIELNGKWNWKNHMRMIATLVIWLIAVWVSDLTLATIGMLLGTLYVYRGVTKHEWKLSREVWLYAGIGVMSCVAWLWYLKGTAMKTVAHYGEFNILRDMISGVGMMWDNVWMLLSFNAETVWLSIHAWLVVVVMLLSLYVVLFHRDWLKDCSWKWICVFAIDFVGIIGVNLLMKWVYLNEMGWWYFVPSYISMGLLILMLYDGLNTDFKMAKWGKLLLWITMLVGGWDMVHYMLTYDPGNGMLKSKVEVMEELDEYGEVGIIGEYWKSYVLMVAHPERVKATPCEGNEAKCQWMIDTVMAQPRLMVVKDAWLDSFPDTMQQYGRTLIKVGDPVRKAYSEMCEYQLVK